MGQQIVIKLPVDLDNIASLNKNQLEKFISVKDEADNPAHVIGMPKNMTLKRVESATILWWEGSPGCVTFIILGKPFTI